MTIESYSVSKLEGNKMHPHLQVFADFFLFLKIQHKKIV